MFDAGVGLVHHFDGAFLEGDEGELVAVGNFDGFGETEAIDPERQDGLDFIDEQDWSDFFHVHGSLLLDLIGLQSGESEKQEGG